MKCRKCESLSIGTVYDKVLDTLHRHCKECGYDWNDPPADRGKRELTTAEFLGFISDKNIGHGHVYPRPDGARARCGGPGLCSECSKELAQKQAEGAS